MKKEQLDEEPIQRSPLVSADLRLFSQSERQEQPEVSLSEQSSESLFSQEHNPISEEHGRPFNKGPVIESAYLVNNREAVPVIVPSEDNESEFQSALVEDDTAQRSQSKQTLERQHLQRENEERLKREHEREEQERLEQRRRERIQAQRLLDEQRVQRENQERLERERVENEQRLERERIQAQRLLDEQRVQRENQEREDRELLEGFEIIDDEHPAPENGVQQQPQIPVLQQAPVIIDNYQPPRQNDAPPQPLVVQQQPQARGGLFGLGWGIGGVQLL